MASDRASSGASLRRVSSGLPAFGSQATALRVPPSAPGAQASSERSRVALGARVSQTLAGSASGPPAESRVLPVQRPEGYSSVGWPSFRAATSSSGASAATSAATMPARAGLRESLRPPAEPLAPAAIVPFLYGRDESLVRASWYNLYIACFTGPVTLDRIEAVYMDLHALARRQGRVALVSLLGQGSTPPNEQARALVASHRGRLGGRLCAAAHVVEARGFVASSILSVLLESQLRGRAVRAERTFRRRAEVGSWLLPHVRAARGSRELLLAIEGARQQSTAGAVTRRSSPGALSETERARSAFAAARR